MFVWKNKLQWLNLETAANFKIIEFDSLGSTVTGKRVYWPANADALKADQKLGRHDPSKMHNILASEKAWEQEEAGK